MIIELLKSNSLVKYDFAMQYMKARLEKIIAKEANSAIWLLEHPSIYTAGISATSDEIFNYDNLKIYYTERGGKFTYHGPGQRVIYLMLNIKELHNNKPDVHFFIQQLQNWLINVLAKYNIMGEVRENRIGIWVTEQNEEKKIAAIGLKIRKWVSYHGIAINLSPDINYFKGIIPCGIKNYGITSFKELGKNVSMEELDKTLVETFEKTFSHKLLNTNVFK